MKIITYAASLTDEAPERYRCCARILFEGKLLPIVTYGATKSEAREKAQAFWEGELERERNRRTANERRVEAMRQAREARAGAA